MLYFARQVDAIHQKDVAAYHRNLQSRTVPPGTPGAPGGSPSLPLPGLPSKPVTTTFKFYGVVLKIAKGSTITIKCIITILNLDRTTDEYEEEVEVNHDGTGDMEIDAEVCVGCTTTVEAGACIRGDCDGYDESETNQNLVAYVSAVRFNGVINQIRKAAPLIV